MSDQLPDFCLYRNSKWKVYTFGGLELSVPSHENLGLSDLEEAGYSQLINHYVVAEDRIFLQKIEVVYPVSEQLEIVPKFNGVPVGKEIITRFMPVKSFNSDGEKQDWSESHSLYFVFGDGELPISGSGEIILKPFIDHWEYPAKLSERLLEKMDSAFLTFHDGILVDEFVREE